MGKHNTVESLARLLQVIKILGKEDGTTVTQISNATGIDRWTVRDMIDSLEIIDTDGNGLYINERVNPADHRQILYSIDKNKLWSLTLPGLNLTDEEGMLLAVLLQQAGQVPVLKDSSEGLINKINWLKDADGYRIYNVNATERIVGSETKEAVGIILNAIQKDRCIEFNYNNAVGRRSGLRRVMPLYMFAYDGGLYLNAQKLEDGEMRSYAVERIQGLPIVIDVKKKDKPQKAEYDGRLEDPLSPFPDHEEFELTVTFTQWQGWYNMQKRWPESVKVTQNGDGSVVMRVRTRSCYGAKKWVLGQWNEVIKIEPKWMRDDILQSVEAMVKRI